MDRGAVRTTLADGTPVIVRGVEPGDAAALLEGFARLSPQSRVFRFLRVVKHLSPADVDRFTSPDHAEHEAIGALAGVDCLEPAGIAHFFRAPLDRQRAELALTVIDAFQRRGLGTLLLGRLVRLAAGAGIARLDAIVHQDNSGMVQILRQLGAGMRRDGTTLVCDLAVHRDPAAYPDNRTGDRIRAAWQLKDVSATA